MICLFGAIGFGLVVVFRWWGGWQPLFKMTAITLVSLLVAGPLGFLAGIGAFDYWAYYALGLPDARGRPLRPRRARRGATTSASTPTTR